MTRHHPDTTHKESAPLRAPLHTYLAEIARTPLLTPDEEHDLAWRIQEGDTAARDLMIRANLRLVVNIARAYVGEFARLEDLIEEGNLGLIRAVEGFDPDMQTHFSTYASYWIKQALTKWIYRARSIRLPAYAVQLLRHWQQASIALEKQLNRPPLDTEVNARLQLSPRKVAIVKRALQALPRTRLDDQISDEEASAHLLVSHSNASPEEHLLDQEQLTRMMALLDQLDDRKARLLRLRFGLDGTDALTLQQIGVELGLTRERVRQLEQEALRELKAKLQAAESQKDPSDSEGE